MDKGFKETLSHLKHDKIIKIENKIYANKIRGYSHYTKKQLIQFLKERQLMPKEKPKPKKDIDLKFARLATIKLNPKRVKLKNIETKEELEFPSIYKAAQFLKEIQIHYYFGREGYGTTGMR